MLLDERRARSSVAARLLSGSHGGAHTHGILALVVLGAVSLAVAAVLGWNLSGGRFLIMETPSMCPNVCVGSLVADRPLEGLCAQVS